MLTDEQRGLLIEGFRLGLSDKLLADRLSVSYIQVYKFRRSKDISAKDLLDNRLASWVSLIRQGISLHIISDMYNVKPASIRQMLWREIQFSFKDLKDEMKTKLPVGLKKTEITLLGQARKK